MSERKQLSLFPVASESEIVSIAPTASEKQILKQQAIQRFLDTGEREHIPHVNTYQVRKTKNHYYRLSYRNSFGKMKHLHIPGGNTRSRLAQYRAKKLRNLIDRGCDLEEAIAVAQTFRSE